MSSEVENWPRVGKGAVNYDFLIKKLLSASPFLMLGRRKRENSPLFSHYAMRSFFRSGWANAKTTAIISENNGVCRLACCPGLLLALRIWWLTKVRLGKKGGADPIETCCTWGRCLEAVSLLSSVQSVHRTLLPPPQFLEAEPDELITFSIHRRKHWE